MPDDLEVTAWTEDGTIMAVQHKKYPQIQVGITLCLICNECKSDAQSFAKVPYRNPQAVAYHLIVRHVDLSADGGLGRVLPCMLSTGSKFKLQDGMHACAYNACSVHIEVLLQLDCPVICKAMAKTAALMLL